MPAWPAHELCYLQLRMICELIALGCLAAHGELLRNNRRRLLREYNADRIVRKLSKLHASFYPRPSRQVLDERTGRPISVEPIENDYLHKKDLLALYRESSDNLHRGSLKKLLQQETGSFNFDGISEWKARIVTLLNHHQIQLIDRDEMFWVLMESKEDGKVHGALMRRVNTASI